MSGNWYEQGVATGMLFWALTVGKRTLDGNTKALHRIASAVEGCRERRRRLARDAGAVFLDDEEERVGEGV